MSNISQFFGGGGGVPIGGYVDLPDSAPTVYQDGAATYLRSGATDLTTTYPKIPSNLLGPIYSQDTMIPEINSTVGGSPNAIPFAMAKNAAETVIVAFPMNNTQNFKYWYSSNSGATWSYLLIPGTDSVNGDSSVDGKSCGGVYWFNSTFVFMNTKGDVFKSTDGKTWTKSTTLPASKLVVANNRLFAFSSISTAIVNWSADGITWNVLTMPAAGNWSDVAHNGSAYVMIQTYSGVVYRLVTTGDPTGTWIAPASLSLGAAGVVYPAAIFADGVNFHISTFTRAYNAGYFTAYETLVHRSTDGGGVWSSTTLANTSAGPLIPTNSFSQTYVPYFIKNGSTLNLIHTGTSGIIVYSSTNDGASYTTPDTTIAQNGAVFQPSIILNRLSILKVGQNFISIGLMRYSSYYAAAYSCVSPYPTTTNTATLLQQTNLILGPVQIHAVKSTPGDAVVFIDGPGRQYYTTNTYSGSVHYTNTNNVQSNGSNSNFVEYSSVNSLTDEYYYFTASPSRDGTGTWTRRRLPYIGAWKSSGYGKNNEFYVMSSASTGTTTTIHNGSASTLTREYRLYKTTDFVTWTRIVDLPAYSTMCGITDNATSTTIFTRDAGSYVTRSLSNDGLTLGSAVSITSALNTYQTVSDIHYAPSTQTMYVAYFSNTSQSTALYYSKSNGATWTTVPNLNNIISVGILNCMTVNRNNGDVYLLFSGTTENQMIVYHIRNDAFYKQHTLSIEIVTPRYSTAQCFHDDEKNKLYIKVENSLFVSSTSSSDLAFSAYSTTYDTSISGTSVSYFPGGASVRPDSTDFVNDFAVIDDIAYVVASDGVRRSTPGKYIQNYKYASSAAGTTKYMRVS